MKERYKEHQWAHHDAMVRAFPGVPEMLDALTARGVRMAVVTSKLEPSARRSLDFLGLSRHFECVVGLEATVRHKPDPEPVRYALGRLGAGAGEAAFVGDSPHDVLAGNAAGVATVATLWGPFSREELAQGAGPRAWAERVGEVVGRAGEVGLGSPRGAREARYGQQGGRSSAPSTRSSTSAASNVSGTSGRTSTPAPTSSGSRSSTPSRRAPPGTSSSAQEP